MKILITDNGKLIGVTILSLVLKNLDINKFCKIYVSFIASEFMYC
jgi:hypothetical protein